MRPTTALSEPRMIPNSVRFPILVLSSSIPAMLSASPRSACMKSAPSWLGRPDGLKKPVSIGEILDALVELDRHPPNPQGGKPMRVRSTIRLAA